MPKQQEKSALQKVKIDALQRKLERMKFKLKQAQVREADLDLDHARLWEEKFSTVYNLEMPGEDVLAHIAYKRDLELAPGLAMLRHGYLIARRIKRLLDGEGVTEVGSVLDFGSGPGRVTRFLDCLGEGVGIYGCDIDAEAIGWARDHLAESGTYFVSHDRPPLPLPAGAGPFGAIVVLSVFTHLPEDMQYEWLEELAKWLAPGGLVLATFHGPSYYRFIPEHDREVFERDGFVHSNLGETPDLPDYYLSTFHSYGYIEKNWSRYFKLRRIVPQEIGGQDVALLERL